MIAYCDNVLLNTNVARLIINVLKIVLLRVKKEKNVLFTWMSITNRWGSPDPEYSTRHNALLRDDLQDIKGLL
jgi:hypothetical protein